MKTNAPKSIIWIISVILGVIGIVLFIAGKWAPYNFWLVAAGFVLLALGSIFKGA